MTAQQSPSDLRALDELGDRFEAALTSRQTRATRARQTLLAAAAAVGAALAGAPALAAVTDLSMPGFFNSHSELEQVLPQASSAIDAGDPVATGRALRTLGYQVQWSLVEDGQPGGAATTARTVRTPPPGTQIIAVAAADGWAVNANTKRLVIEVAPKRSAIARSHR